MDRNGVLTLKERDSLWFLCFIYFFSPLSPHFVVLKSIARSLFLWPNNSKTKMVDVLILPNRKCLFIYVFFFSKIGKLRSFQTLLERELGEETCLEKGFSKVTFEK